MKIISTIVLLLIMITLWYLIIKLTWNCIINPEINRESYSENYYITWDQEGDYLLWNSEPEFRDGLWMPTEDGFNCTFISEEALSVIADFKEVDQILKSGECVKIKKYIP